MRIMLLMLVMLFASPVCAMNASEVSDTQRLMSPPNPPAQVELENAEQEKQLKCEQIGGAWIGFINASDGHSYGKRCEMPEETEAKKKCLANKQQGVEFSWELWGFAKNAVCVAHYDDGGKPCESSSECISKFCIGDVHTRQTGRGRCMKNSNAARCSQKIEDALANKPFVCAD